MKKSILIVALSAFAFTAKAQVTTLYGNGTSGYSISNTTADSISCRFNDPYGCAFDTKGNLWITDQGDNYIVLISSGLYQPREGDVSGGFNDGTSLGQNGGLTNAPTGIVVVPGKTSARDQIYLCDAGNNAIRKIDSFIDIGHAQRMSTVAGGGTKTNGVPGESGYVNGSGANSLFSSPTGLGYINDAAGGYLVVADRGNNAVRKVSLHASDYGSTADMTTAIQNPTGIFVDRSNNIFVASTSQGIFEISNTNKVLNIVPSIYFEEAASVVVKGTDMYIGDNCHIAYFNMKQPASTSNPSVLTGNPPDIICAYENGADSVALFNGINSLTFSQDSSYLIVADAMNNRFRKVILPVPDTSGSAFKPVHASKNTFNLYPNPASGYIYINNKISADADISLVNVTGKQVFNEKNVMLNAGQPYSLDIENQPAGVYVLQITTNSGTYNNKVILR